MTDLRNRRTLGQYPNGRPWAKRGRAEIMTTARSRSSYPRSIFIWVWSELPTLGSEIQGFFFWYSLILLRRVQYFFVLHAPDALRVLINWNHLVSLWHVYGTRSELIREEESLWSRIITGFIWYAWVDSNHRPLDPECNELVFSIVLSSIE